MKFGKHSIHFGWGDIVIAKNKSFEYQIEIGKRASDFTKTRPYECSLVWKSKTDHAGISFIFGLYKLIWINLNIHDHRHWNEDEGRWMKPEEYH